MLMMIIITLAQWKKRDEQNTLIFLFFSLSPSSAVQVYSLIKKHTDRQENATEKDVWSGKRMREAKSVFQTERESEKESKKKIAWTHHHDQPPHGLQST